MTLAFITHEWYECNEKCIVLVSGRGSGEGKKNTINSRGQVQEDIPSPRGELETVTILDEVERKTLKRLLGSKAISNEKRSRRETKRPSKYLIQTPPRVCKPRSAQVTPIPV